MPAHTPGPWVVSENKRERTIQVDTANGRGTVVQPRAISWAPDARLIAAAPALLEALEATLYQDAPCEFGWDCLDKPCLPCMVRAAIAQAKGETV